MVLFSPEGVGTDSPLKEGCRDDVLSFNIGLGFSVAGVAVVVVVKRVVVQFGRGQARVCGVVREKRRARKASLWGKEG